MLPAANQQPAIEARITHVALRIVYERMLLSVGLTLAVSLFFGGVLLLPFFPHDLLGRWLISIQAVGLIRLGLWWWYRREQPGIEHNAVWFRRFMLGSVAAAASWSTGAFTLMAQSGPIEVVMLCVTLLAVSSVAVSSQAAVFPSLVAFTVVCLGPLASLLMIQGRGLEKLVGLALVASMVTLFWTGRQSTRMTHRLLRTEFELSAAIDQTRAAKASAEQASLAKSRFLATMSHEVRTPLSGILGLAELLERSSLSTEQRDRLRLLRRSGDYLREIVDNVLDFSKIEAEQMEIAQLEFAPRQFLRELVEFWGERAAQAQLLLSERVAQELPQLLCGDPLRLRQILSNFIGNALKFTAQGCIELHAQPVSPADGADAAQVRVRFAVTDSGIGIATDAAQHVFDSFTQVDDSYSRRFGGTGLGLAICRRLTELMGGQIGVDSVPGLGSTFWIEVPLQRTAATPAMATPQLGPPLSQAAPTAGTLRGRVLVAEDNEINREVCGAMLEVLGVEYIYAQDGAQALAMADNGTFDLVLMDCQMPVIDGYAATRVLRERGIVARSGQRLPIVAVTANAFAEDRDHARQAGMDGFLSKPMRLDDLRQAIAPWLTPAPDSTNTELSATGG